MFRQALSSRYGKLLIAVLAALVAATAAYAAWTILTSQKVGHGRSGALQAPTVVEASQADFLTAGGVAVVPGGKGDLAYLVTNPNSVPIALAGVSTTSPTVNPPTTSDEVNCSGATYFGYGTMTPTMTPATIPANSTATVVLLKDALTLAANAPDACQALDVHAALNLRWSTG